MDEKKERSLRRKAIRWMLDGLRSGVILKRLGRSRAWLSKWKKRFDKLGWEGLRSESRSPHTVEHRYDGRTRRLVIQARRRWPLFIKGTIFNALLSSLLDNSDLHF